MTTAAWRIGSDRPAIRAPLIAIGALASVIVIIGLSTDLRLFAAAFVTAYVAVLSIVLGALALIMIAHLTTATWFSALRPRAELIISALPVLALLGGVMIPLVVVLHRPVTAAANPAQRFYLSTAFVVGRAIIYWVAWLGIAHALRSAERSGEQGDHTLVARRCRRVASVGLIVLALTMTAASFDWMMSFTPDWYSTIYGIDWFAGGMIGALSLLALLVRYRTDDDVFRVVATEQRQALAKLLLTFVMFWIYIGFAQYIVIWSADLPSEVGWYASRAHGSWGFVGLALLLVGGLLPFLALLIPSVRNSAQWLATLGAVLLVAHHVDACWVTMPDLVPTTWWILVAAVATLIIVAGVTSAVVVTSHPGIGARARTPGKL